jgi:hypothetical protein
VAVLALALGIAVPLPGISLAAFLDFDTVLCTLKSRGQQAGTVTP